MVVDELLLLVEGDALVLGLVVDLFPAVEVRQRQLDLLLPESVERCSINLALGADRFLQFSLLFVD